ncbi:DUF885 domain-containing protein [Porticoccaceae bacterium]|nr:DUF885 domain-containing protein [Porticoccaceae bacterium]
MSAAIKIFKYLVGLLLVAVLGAYFWFWATPVGINNYINKVSFQLAIDSPELITALGIIDNTPLDFHSGKLASYTLEAEEESLARLRTARAGLDHYGPEGLEGQELLSWQIAAWFFEDLIRSAEHPYGGYMVNQISGPMVNLPQFLTDRHQIINDKSLTRYISRLEEFGRVIGEVKLRVMDARDNGTVPPDFIIEKVLVGMRAFSEASGNDNVLIANLPAKLEKLDNISPERKLLLSEQAVDIVDNQIVPQYLEMIALFETLLSETNHDAGIWRLPQGEAIYTQALKSNTTTDMSAEQIHKLGLSEVARIELEMAQILTELGMTEGSIFERIQTLMELPEHNFPNTDEGRAEQIAYLNQVNDQLMAMADQHFVTIPPQPLEILWVPLYAQDSSPGGYYQPPALDGSTPGRFYINQKDTSDNPRWKLPTFMYHEGAPGHHFQISAAQLIEDVPLLRKLSPFSAYTEGWALYAERIAFADMAVYDQDPLGNLGRLQDEMFRAVRLVVDTGMHAKRWSREKAIDYMRVKTGLTQAEVTREIERYVVWPGQATSYKVGQQAILAVRAKAELALGEQFDSRLFHEALLSSGAMPLAILEWNIDQWIAQQKAK